MIELKTLKDFHGYSINELLKECNKDIKEANDNVLHDEYIRLSLLKQEAIEYIKFMKKLKTKKSPMYLCPNCEEDITKWTIQWIKHFFNITEEDLK